MKSLLASDDSGSSSARRRTRPVLFRLMLIVVAAAFAVQAISALVIASKRAEMKRSEQESHIALLMNSRAKLLAAPLWKMQFEAVESLIGEMKDDPAIVSVSAIDSAGASVFEQSSKKAEAEPYILDEPIVYEDGNIRTEAGRLRAKITRAPISSAFWNTLAQLMGISFLSVTAIMLAIALATQTFIGRPLARITRAIEQTGSGDGVRHKVDWHSEDELGAVAKAFNAMQDAAERSETELRSINRKLEFLARHDPLTGLPNRRHFSDSISALAAATPQFALHLIDLDEFKAINDTMGHGVGDDLLRHVAARVSECVAGAGMVARLGGDEFAAIQTQCGDEAEAAAFARRLQESIAQPCRLGKSIAHVRSSIGVALQAGRSADMDQTMKMADVALYQAKRAGRGKIAFFTREMLAAHDERRTTEAALLAAFGRSEFVVHFQPQVRPSDLSIVGLEALVRWRHPTRGLVPPDEFLPIIDELGLGGQLGTHVISQSCLIARKLSDMGRGDVRVAINLSAEQLSDPALAQQIETKLMTLGLTGNALELEITEGALIQSLDVATGALARLRGLGATVALDDFGTGYSSLSYIRQFPIDRIKIDRSFTRELPDIPETASIVRAIRDLARALDLTLLAEGVECESEAEALVREGVEFAQGFLYGRPEPFDALAPRLLPMRTLKAS